MTEESKAPTEHEQVDSAPDVENASDAVEGDRLESAESASESGAEDVVADEPVVEGSGEAIGDPAGEAVDETEADADDSDAEDSSGDDSSGDDSDSDESDGESENAAPRGPIELIEEAIETDDELEMQWYILKVQVNRENSICDALKRRVAIEGLERYFGDILVPTEDVREFTKSGKQRIVKRKLYPGYIVVHMSINDDTWFLVRETPGIGDFTGAAGKPSPLDSREIEKILQTSKRVEDEDETAPEIKTAIKFRSGDRVRVKEGYFQNFEGEVEGIDESNGRVTVMINIFGRPTPVELDHWQVEDV